jgi:hypothetical protein
MDYTIKAVMPGQIQVEFADQSHAIVPIRPEYTLDQVDQAVSSYDADYRPDPASITHQGLAVGDVRTSVAKTDPIFDPPAPTVAPAPSFLIDPADFAMAHYLETLGDSRAMVILYDRIKARIDEPAEVDAFLADLSVTPEDIVAQAEAELASGT